MFKNSTCAKQNNTARENIRKRLSDLVFLITLDKKSLIKDAGTSV